MTSLDSLYIAHESLYGESPSEVQATLYRSYPSAHGVSGHDLNPEVFAATLILAIVQTYPKRQQASPFKCYFFVRADANDWCLEQTKVCAKKMFEVQKQQKKVDVAKYLGLFFKAIMIGSRVLQFKDAPDRWTAFGFAKSDPVPEWMLPSLLEISP